MLGPLISAGASLLGGLMGKSSADKAREQANAHSLRQEALQKEFAQNGIQWKVADARAAGIHPIYALGGSTASYAPTAQAFTADTSLPNAFASAGQDLGRAIHATRTDKDRMGAVGTELQRLQLDGAKLDNEHKRVELASKMARLKADQVGPPAPGDDFLQAGQAQSGLTKAKPMEITPTRPGARSQEPAPLPVVGFGNEAKGMGFSPMPSKDTKERIEDNVIQEIMWALRNNVLPSLGYKLNPPPHSAGKDRQWIYDFMHQAYRSSPNVESKYGYGKRPAGWYIR